MKWLVQVVTSFKIWFFFYAFLLLLSDLIFFTYFPLTILGTLVVFGLLLKFQVALALDEDVESFFGTILRPYLVNSDQTISSSSTSGGEEQGGLTIKSRLQLMKGPSPQMASTPNGHQNGGGRGSGSDKPLIIIGHRGACLDAPENSLSAFRECKKRGCEAIEFDVALTKDKVPVLFHDDNLLRIAGIDRDITDMTWEELQRVDISVLHPLGQKYKKERVATFEEAVNLCLSLGMKFIIDLKSYDEEVINAIVSQFQKHKMYSMAVVSSFYVNVIYEIRRRDPKIIGCMAWRPGFFRYRSWTVESTGRETRFSAFYMEWLAIIADWANGWAVRNLYWWFVGLSAILIHKDAITKEDTYIWMKKGVRCYAWTVNSPLEKLHLVENVHLGYLTDTLDGGEPEPST